MTSLIDLMTRFKIRDVEAMEEENLQRVASFFLGVHVHVVFKLRFRALAVCFQCLFSIYS